MAVNPKNGLLDLEKELTCSICTEVLYQPLTLLDCLHTFCGSCLKEWFSWQATNSPKDNPYSCPSCRASVRETRPDAKVTTLLDMFLQANPAKGKSKEEREAMNAVYKPGDRVMPKIGRRVELEGDDEDRRLLEEVRERSLRETMRSGRRVQDAGSRPGDYPLHLYNSLDLQAHDHYQGRDPVEVTNRLPDRGSSSHETGQASRSHQSSHSEAQARQVGHQSSLRSLLSSSDHRSSEMEEEIMRQITEEGLLDGIDLSSIDISQEDEISERIAEAYRRRQRERPRALSSRQNSNDGRSDQTRELREDRPHRRHHARSRSAATRQEESSHPRSTSAQHFQTVSSNRARRTWRESVHDSLPTSQGLAPASRSSNDVSVTAREPLANASGRQRSSEAGRFGPGGSPSQYRSTTDPEMRISDLWRQGGAGNRSPRTGTEMSQTVHSAQNRSSPGVDHAPVLAISSAPRSPNLLPTQPSTGQESVTDRARTAHGEGSRILPSNDVSLSSVSQLATEVQGISNDLTVHCRRCGKSHIEYELHYNCPQCDDGKYNICLRCYRTGRGCRYWFGFGYASLSNYERSAPPGGYPLGHPLPHILTGHRYQRPVRAANQMLVEEDGHSISSKDALSRFQSGAFCSICLIYANECFWKCDLCNQGEWGFCNRDVNQGNCCTHSLLPLTHISTIKDSARRGVGSRNASVLVSGDLPRTASVLRGPGVMDLGPFKPLTFSTKCDICTYPIQPSVTRYHCPRCNEGDYDICTNCYLKLIASGRISAENGHQGWRRCLRGHRMIVVGFEDRDGGQRRVVVKHLVGGTALKDQSADDASKEDWSWKDTDNGKQQSRTVTKEVCSSTSESCEGNSLVTGDRMFPPDGGVGMRVAARYSRYPEDDAVDELMFPRGAEVWEVEDVNGDWYWGCYAGAKGLFPSNHVRRIDGIV